MTKKLFISLHELARRLGLPAAWLRAEAKAGRIPFLQTGRRTMFLADEVEAVLHTRARDEKGAQPVAR